MRPRIRRKGTLGGVLRLKLPIIDERRGRILAHCKLVAHLLDLRRLCIEQPLAESEPAIKVPDRTWLLSHLNIPADR